MSESYSIIFSKVTLNSISSVKLTIDYSNQLYLIKSLIFGIKKDTGLELSKKRKLPTLLLLQCVFSTNLVTNNVILSGCYFIILLSVS